MLLITSIVSLLLAVLLAFKYTPQKTPSILICFSLVVSSLLYGFLPVASYFFKSGSEASEASYFKLAVGGATAYVAVVMVLGALIYKVLRRAKKRKPKDERHDLWLVVVTLLLVLSLAVNPGAISLYSQLSVGQESGGLVGHTEQALVSSGPPGQELLLLGRLGGSVGGVVVRSAGYGSGESFVKNSIGKVALKRGLTLVGLAAERAPTKLNYVDTCGGSVTDEESIDHSGNFKASINRRSNSFSAFLIVGHDSVVCHKKEHLNIVMPEPALEALNGISLRQPYIAMIPEGGDAREFLGEREGFIRLKINNVSESQGHIKQRQLHSIERVAHAGGGYDGRTYTNSIEALNYNKDKYTLFEIDFAWTSDEELVCLHDWEGSFERSFKMKTKQPVSYRKFIQLVRERSDLEKCTLSSLIAWLEENPSQRVVTDIKENNPKALKLIAKRYPRLRHRFVPQVYEPSEYYTARRLGFSDVIWTLYRFRGDNSSVLEHLKKMDLYGLAMPRYKADVGLARLAFKETGVLSYVHTINNKGDHAKYLGLGVSEIYTDWIY
jgi:hypothetical protein